MFGKHVAEDHVVTVVPTCELCRQTMKSKTSCSCACTVTRFRWVGALMCTNSSIMYHVAYIYVSITSK